LKKLDFLHNLKFNISLMQEAEKCEFSLIHEMATFCSLANTFLYKIYSMKQLIPLSGFKFLATGVAGLAE
jgi:hypothetical protein